MTWPELAVIVAAAVIMAVLLWKALGAEFRPTTPRPRHEDHSRDGKGPK